MNKIKKINRDIVKERVNEMKKCLTIIQINERKSD